MLSVFQDSIYLCLITFTINIEIVQKLLRLKSVYVFLQLHLPIEVARFVIFHVKLLISQEFFPLQMFADLFRFSTSIACLESRQRWNIFNFLPIKTFSERITFPILLLILMLPSLCLPSLNSEIVLDLHVVENNKG